MEAYDYELSLLFVDLKSTSISLRVKRTSVLMERVLDCLADVVRLFAEREQLHISE